MDATQRSRAGADGDAGAALAPPALDQAAADSPRSPSASRSPKRRRSSPAASSSINNDLPHNDTEPGDTRDLSTTEDRAAALRDENQSLQRENLELQAQLRASQRAARDLEADVARVYRQAQAAADLQRRAFEQEQRALAARVQELQDARQPHKYTESLSAETTSAMDAYVASADAWQRRLARLSALLAAQVAKLEQQQAAAALRDAVAQVELQAHVELQARHDEQLYAAELQRAWDAATLRDHRAALAATALAQREAAELEAMERTLLLDRVLELETQRQQQRANARDKEQALAKLRADHEAIVSTSALVPKDEWAASVKEREGLRRYGRELKTRAAQQGEQLAALKDEVLSLKFQNQELLDDAARRGDGRAELSERHQRAVDALEAELAAAKAREQQLQLRLDGELDRGSQAQGELQIVYAKFGAAMDSVAAQSTKLAALEQQLEDRSAELERAQSELDELRREHRELLEQRRGEPQVGGASSPSRKRRRRPDPDQALGGGEDDEEVQQLADRHVYQRFMQQYYRAAEHKCGELSQQVAALEAQREQSQQQTREATDKLRTRLQAASCDDQERKLLLAAVSELERI